MLTLVTPAKVNLTLEVLYKRDDGFHEIRSVIQTVNLLDRLRFADAEDTVITSDSPGWNASASLVSRAVDIMKQEAGFPGGVSIEIEKNIPLLSGLGGDSSDAAAVLRGLNRLWGLNLPHERMLELAAGLGSDVPYFLSGGTALLEGRGEKVTPLSPLSAGCILLAMPPVVRQTGKTKRLYESIQSTHFTEGRYTARMTENAKTGWQIDPALIYNVFDNVAYGVYSGLGAAREQFIEVGGRGVHLAGSGPVLFTLVKDRPTAEKLAYSLIEKRMEPYIVEPVTTVENPA